MDWFEDPLTAAAALPVFLLPLFIFLSAFLEYVFPPYWGDVFVLLGFFLAGQGVVSPWIIFGGALAGGVLGSLCAFLLGRRYGMSILRRIERGRDRRQRANRLLERHGPRLLIVNRFLPVVRGLMLYGAGGLELRLGASMAYSTISNLAWLALLMGAGLWTAGTWEEILARFENAKWVLGVAAVVLVLGWVAVLIWRRHRNLRT